MSKYINTKDLELEVSHYLQCEKESEAITLEELKEITNRLPPADCAKVVRCKDCKHLVEIDPDNLYVCDRIDIGMDGEPSFLSPENDFCSKGERKETI